METTKLTPELLLSLGFIEATDEIRTVYRFTPPTGPKGFDYYWDFQVYFPELAPDLIQIGLYAPAQKGASWNEQDESILVDIEEEYTLLTTRIKTLEGFNNIYTSLTGFEPLVLQPQTVE